MLCVLSSASFRALIVKGKVVTKITKAQLRVLNVLIDAPITEFGLTVYGIQRRTLQSLSDAGLAKFRPYGKPPSWAITASGRLAVSDAAASWAGQ